MSDKAKRRRTIIRAIEVGIKSAIGVAAIMGAIVVVCGIASLILRALGVE